MRDAYLTLLQAVITNTIYEDVPIPVWGAQPYERETRDNGRDWPMVAHSMIGSKRMSNLRFACSQVIERGVEGDFIETGVWRGGASIFMRGVLKAYGCTDRKVWVADSFEGLPPPDADAYPVDKDSVFHNFPQLAVSMEQVQANFAKYGLLDAQVVFLKGWFKDTLPMAPIQKLAIMRLDGDMYESTINALDNLYGKLSIGGFAIIDDYGIVPECKQAVHDYRVRHSISDITQPLIDIDGIGAYWIKALA
jgi:hypothetical protein